MSLIKQSCMIRRCSCNYTLKKQSLVTQNKNMKLQPQILQYSTLKTICKNVLVFQKPIFLCKKLIGSKILKKWRLHWSSKVNFRFFLFALCFLECVVISGAYFFLQNMGNTTLKFLFGNMFYNITVANKIRIF